MKRRATKRNIKKKTKIKENESEVVKKNSIRAIMLNECKG